MSTHSIELAQLELQKALDLRERVKARANAGDYRASPERDCATAELNVQRAEKHLRDEQLFDHLSRLKQAVIERQQAEERVRTASGWGSLIGLIVANIAYQNASQKLLAVLNEDVHP